MNVFFLGCPHFNSRQLLPFRNFATPKAQDEIIINSINNNVDKSDRLYILGDYDMSDNFEKAKKIRDKINCGDVRLTPGNHEKLSMTQYRKIFQQVEYILEYKFGQDPSERIILSHYPFAAWNHSYRGSINGYSHLHGKCEPYFDHYLPERKSIDLGIDNYYRLFREYRPFSLDEILTLLNDRKGNSPDRLSFRVTKCDPQQSFEGDIQRYFITTDFNFGQQEAEQNTANFKLLVEEPNLQKYTIRLYHQFDMIGNYAFLTDKCIPVGSIVSWIK